MTREEAIDYLQDAKSALPHKFDKALDMAIESLSAPSGDLISRADAMAEFREWVKRANENGKTPTWNDAVSLIGSLPSADAEPTVIRSKTLLPTKDFKEWAKRIKEVNPNAVVIPCDAEVASADAIHSGGVFVPNMEMPKVCDYCLFHDSEWSWCKAKNKYCGDGKCPLIAVRGERKEP